MNIEMNQFQSGQLDNVEALFPKAFIKYRFRALRLYVEVISHRQEISVLDYTALCYITLSYGLLFMIYIMSLEI